MSPDDLTGMGRSDLLAEIVRLRANERRPFAEKLLAIWSEGCALYQDGDPGAGDTPRDFPAWSGATKDLLFFFGLEGSDSRRLCPSQGTVTLKPITLSRSVARRYDEQKISVLADWCEEHGLVEAATVLREPPGGSVRGMAEALLVILTGEVSYSIFWEDGWFPQRCEDCSKHRILLLYWLPRRRSVRLCRSCFRGREERGALPRPLRMPDPPTKSRKPSRLSREST